jgi:competence protein ComEC
VLLKGFRKHFMDIVRLTGKLPVSGLSFEWSGWREMLLLEYAVQKKQLFIWAPVFLALGIGFYFSLPAEPPMVPGFFALIISSGGLFLFRHRTAALIVFLVVLGFLAAQLRTHIVHTPVLQKELSPVMVEGIIDAVEDFGDTEGSRLILSHPVIEDLLPEQTPRKIRLKVRKDHGLLAGQRVRMLAGLNAPSAPVAPGGFDFQRHLYFQGIGAVGFSFKEPEIIADVPAHSFDHFIEKQRQSIASRIEAGMKYPEAAVAIALTVGRMTAIEREEQELWRDSGLAHALSISGLHVGMFSGIVFFFFRLVMVLIPGFALRYPVKKIAAVIAMAGACYYMFLAGATIPTQRSVLMTGIVLLAITLDRSPISLRLVSFTAFAVLLFFPESLLSASFQMSFAAVTCLILFYDWLRPWWSEWHRQAGFIRRVLLYFVSVCLTTLVASAATAPLGLFHFQQFATYGLLGNLLGVPIMAFIIMPAIVAVFFLIPLHLEFLAFYPLQLGIDWTIDIVHWVALLPHADIHAASWPLVAQACRIGLKGYDISYLRHPSAAEEECARADIVIAELPVEVCAASYVVDMFDARDRGAHAFWLGRNGIEMQDVETQRGYRPWSGLNKNF